MLIDNTYLIIETDLFFNNSTTFKHVKLSLLMQAFIGY